jgi:hypothetical protein
MGTREPVKFYLDHSNLLYFKTANYLSPKQAQWASFLDMFNMLIYHVNGTKNLADAPSRREDYIGGKRIKSDSFSFVSKLATMVGEISEQNSRDLYFQRPSTDMISFLKRFYTSKDKKIKGITSNEGILWHQDRVFVPANLCLRLIKLYHDEPTVGHPGIARTLSTITRTFSWPGIRGSVFDYVKTCDSCQRVKAKRILKTGKTVSLVPEPQPWSMIGMDMIVKLPLSLGFDSILVVIDFLSKMSHFIPCKESSPSSTSASLFRKNVFRLHGLPDNIVLDRGPTFVSKFWKSLMTSLNIRSSLSTAYHPQTDGQTERKNQTLEDYLRHFCS